MDNEKTDETTDHEFAVHVATDAATDTNYTADWEWEYRTPRLVIRLEEDRILPQGRGVTGACGADILYKGDVISFTSVELWKLANLLRGLLDEGKLDVGNGIDKEETK